SVLAFSTEFRGQASLSSEPGSFQNATSGNSAALGDEDQPTHSGTTVLSPSVIRSERLIDALELTPNPFTPNGDGINDQVAIAYNILALTKAGAVAVRLYDLSGRLVHTLQQTALSNGRYALTWDGRAAGGQLVPPGVYLLGITVSGDLGDDLQAHPLYVAY
ncbi:MAG: gliding motility-associated C-terminal domain-containing protein, partial [Gemmatimonadota bacterium]|nr:gliding motility-associated C-terminal domain-containing protein [Gemmatimonadota bacterium]